MDFKNLLPGSNQRPQPINGDMLGMPGLGQTSSDSAISYPDDLKQKTTSAALINQSPNGNAPGQGFLLQNQSYLEFQKFLNNRLNQDLQRYRNNPSGANTANSLNLYGVQREPWIFTVFEDLTNVKGAGVEAAASAIQSVDPSKALIWMANPKSVSWQIAQRGVETKNKSGTVLHIWRDRYRKTDYDDPKITFQFQSGNLLPVPANQTTVWGENSSPANNLPQGLNNFYQFLELVDKAKIAKNGAANLVHILYRSRIFPSLVLTGFFDPQMVVQFTDDSQNPLQISGWQASFTVYSTIPRLNDLAQLRGIFQKDGLLASDAGPAQQTGGISPFDFGTQA